MDIQKENKLIQEAFEIEADEVGFCLDQKWGDYENPYENSDTFLAYNLFKNGWQAAKASVIDIQKDFIQRLRGRADFCRDRGEIKTPELLEQAANLLEAAKASVKSESISDIQSWIAVNSFSDLDVAHDNVPVVDANELAKYIDSLDLSVSVPEGFVLMPKEPTKDTLIEIASVCIGDDFANLDEAKELYKAVIKAQEQK